jgi:hypothetical protein
VSDAARPAIRSATRAADSTSNATLAVHGEYNSLAFDGAGNLTVIYTKNSGGGNLLLKRYTLAVGFGASAQDVIGNASSGGYYAPVVRWRAASNSMELIQHIDLTTNGQKDSHFRYSGAAAVHPSCPSASAAPRRLSAP